MFSVNDHGSVVLIEPHTMDVLAWLRGHAQEDAQWFGMALVVEPRYVDSLVTALIQEGFAAQ
ncbi:MAG TPA: hypothetical protein VLI07_18765 [Candidatus Binatus sp.]|nr:hypothetical protein [Candidatus Binatus sp.]